LKLARAHVAALASPVAAAVSSLTKSAPQEAVDEAADFDEYQEEDLTYQETLALLKRDLADLGFPLKFVDRGFLPNFQLGQCVAVIVVGQDGLVANTAKYVARVADESGKSLPIVAVNPDPKRYDGILLPFRVRQARRALQRTLDRQARIREVTLAEANLNDGQQLLAFNDFFLGVASHVSARYTLRIGGRAEVQSSSGMIVATGAGSTGWISSIFNMVEGFARSMGGKPCPPLRLPWEDRRLIWAVREPFRSKHSSAELVGGLLEPGERLVVESLMPSGGVIFSDGIEADYLEFASGTIATLSVSEHRARLVVG
jgi:NAD kinase